MHRGTCVSIILISALFAVSPPGAMAREPGSKSTQQSSHQLKRQNQILRRRLIKARKRIRKLRKHLIKERKKNQSHTDTDLQVELGLQGRGFSETPDRRFDGSVSIAPLFTMTLGETGQSIINFNPFFRYDSVDQQRTHFDLREGYFAQAWDNFQLSVGAKKVFWGVTESIHLVDIVNQTDYVEEVTGEHKLGQPMVHMEYQTEAGNFGLFAMTGFRERTFPGENGRFRFTVPVNSDAQAQYDRGPERWAPDFAFRWDHSMGVFDLGLSHFYGYNREPEFSGTTSLTPIYNTIHQSGADVQATLGSTLLKAEAVRRTDRDFKNANFAGAGGFEHTFFNVAGSFDLGLLGEYLYDSRDNLPASAFQSDVFGGVRLSFSDAASTQLLVGSVFDLKNPVQIYRLEASRRMGENFKLGLSGQLTQNLEQTDPLFPFSQDNYLQLDLSFFWAP